MQTKASALAGTLRRTERVRRRPDFERAYESGVRVTGRYMALFVVENGGPTTRLGVAATRKIGAAVIRNRAKRLARELFRRHKIDAGLDVIIVPRREMVDAPFATLETDYLSALERRGQPSRTGGRRPPPRGRRRPAPRV